MIDLVFHDVEPGPVGVHIGVGNEWGCEPLIIPCGQPNEGLVTHRGELFDVVSEVATLQFTPADITEIKSRQRLAH